MPLLPAARQPEAPPAGSRNPFEAGLTSPVDALAFNLGQADQANIARAGAASSRALFEVAQAAETIESNKRSIAIQSQISELNNQIAAATEVGELAGIQPSVESVVMPHYSDGFDFNPAAMIQRFGPQIARSRLLRDEKERALLRRDADATVEASRTAAIAEGNMEALEAHTELVAGYGSLFGEKVASQLAQDEAINVAEGIILGEIAESERAADAWVDILRDEGLRANDPLASILTDARALALLNTAVGSRNFKRNERMQEDEKALLAELDWAIARGTTRESPTLMARFGALDGHEALLPIIDALGPPESSTFGLVDAGGDSTITAYKPYITRRIRAMEAAERAAAASNKIRDPRPHIERVPGAPTPQPQDPKWDEGIMRYMDQEAAADGYADFSAFYYNAPLPDLQGKIAQLTSTEDGGGRVPLPSKVVQQAQNDILSNAPERIMRAAVVLGEAERYSTRMQAKKGYRSNPEASDRLTFWQTRARYVGAQQATEDLRDAAASNRDFALESNDAMRQIELQGGDDMILEHLQELTGTHSPPFFSEPGQALGSGIARIMESKDQWNLWAANQSVGMRVLGTHGTYGPIILPDTGEEATIGQELGEVVRDIVADPFWIETVRDHRRVRFDNMTSDLDDFPPAIPEAMQEDYRDLLHHTLQSRSHFGDFETAQDIATRELRGRWGISRMNPEGRPTWVEFPPERQWAATGGASGPVGAVQMQLLLAYDLAHKRGYPIDPSMVAFATEAGPAGTDPESGLREYYVKVAIPIAPGRVQWTLLRDEFDNLVTYAPDFVDATPLREELDSERGGVIQTVGDILMASPGLSFARDVITGDQRRQMRQVYPALDEGGIKGVFLQNALMMFQLPKMIPELLEMEDGDIERQTPLDPGRNSYQRWLRSHLPQGSMAEMRLGRERGRELTEGLSREATDEQAAAVAKSVGADIDPQFFQLLEALTQGALPGTGQPRPKQLDPR